MNYKTKVYTNEQGNSVELYNDEEKRTIEIRPYLPKEGDNVRKISHQDILIYIDESLRGWVEFRASQSVLDWLKEDIGQEKYDDLLGEYYTLP